MQQQCGASERGKRAQMQPAVSAQNPFTITKDEYNALSLHVESSGPHGHRLLRVLKAKFPTPRNVVRTTYGSGRVLKWRGAPARMLLPLVAPYTAWYRRRVRVMMTVPWQALPQGVEGWYQFCNMAQEPHIWR
jgi:hypothetical protein